MKLPQFQTANKDVGLLQTTWAAMIEPFISRSQNKSTILKDVDLVVGDNVIKHTLDQELEGWSIVMINGLADIYDKQGSNQNAKDSLILHSSAAVTVSLEVF